MDGQVNAENGRRAAIKMRIRYFGDTRETAFTFPVFCVKHRMKGRP